MKRLPKSPSPAVPHCSGLNSSSTPTEADHEEFNIYKLLVSLLRLKKHSKYQCSSNEASVEQSLDGSVRVYLKRTGDIEETKRDPSVTPVGSSREHRDVVLLEQVFKRLSELPVNQDESSDSDSQQLKISLDNCTVVYFPKDAETEEGPTGEASLPGSLEGSTPAQAPYYNLSSPHTLKFIERAVNSTTPEQPSAPCENIVIESSDHRFVIIHPRTMPQSTESRNFSKFSFNLKVSTRQSDSPGGLRSPLNLDVLQVKLRELSTDESVAIGDDNTRIILEPSQSNSASESQSSHVTSTPLIEVKAPDLMSPHTNRKLLRKLQAVQEDAEGEEDCLRDIDGSTRLYISSFSSSENSLISSTSISATSPTLTQHLPPRHEILSERLQKYSKDSGYEASSEEDYY